MRQKERINNKESYEMAINREYAVISIFSKTEIKEKL
jgi:hypothetical protein